MITDDRGMSTCPPGEERCEGYFDAYLHDYFVQYDYRTPGGDLFSCVARTLPEAREKRDTWLASREVTK